MNKLFLLCLFIGSQILISCGGSKEVAKAPVEMDKSAKVRMADRQQKKAANREELYAQLDFLKEKQISKLKKIHTKYDEKRAEKIQSMMNKQVMMNEELQLLRDKETEDIQKMMSEEEYEKYFDIVLQMGSRKRGPGNMPPPPPPPQAKSK